jgi:hypothetical protein
MTGANGDYYLDVDSGDVYQKASGAWSLIGNIRGPVGPTGDVILNNRAPAGDITIPGGYSASIVGDYEIALGQILEIASDGVMEIS